MKHFITTLVISFFIFTASAQVTSISGVINTYTSLSGISNDTIAVASTSGFSVGDKVLIIQMQGAEINASNSASFGNVTDLNGTGNYEYTTICNMTNSELVVTGIDRFYDVDGVVQVIRVPVYNNALVIGTLTAAPWNGSTGGVLAFECTGILTMNDNINVSETGFRGGTTSYGSYSCEWYLTVSGYFYNISTGEGAMKGEGIASYINGKTGGSGAQSNGGGGSNDHNGGGGGGANVSAGGNGGQRVKPSNFTCGCVLPGTGGKANDYSNSLNTVFLGGGGGAGHENNANTATAGANGGGIVMIKADTLIGTNDSIIARGGSVTANSADGAGGGGAGGTVLLDVNTYFSNTYVDVSGGDGGDVENVGYSNCNGPGGGGSGGVLWVNQSSVPSNLTVSNTGGSSGTTIQTYQSNCTLNGTNQATAGSVGSSLTGLTLVETQCDSASLSLETTICGGDSIYVAGAWQTTTGMYEETYSSGCCDSIVETNLTVLDIMESSFTDTICTGESIEINGTTYSSTVSGAQEVFTNVGSYGCDSTVTFDIYVHTIDTSVSSAPPMLTANTAGATYQWVNCPEFTPIADGNQQAFAAVENGSYAVIISEHGCIDTSNCHSIQTLGIYENGFGNSLRVYPNPTDGYLSIDLESKENQVTLTLSDVQGRIIWTKSKSSSELLQMYLSEPAGLYFLTIESETSKAVVQVIRN